MSWAIDQYFGFEGLADAVGITKTIMRAVRIITAILNCCRVVGGG